VSLPPAHTLSNRDIDIPGAPSSPPQDMIEVAMDEGEKRHRLRRMQLIALALLPLMAILLVVSGRLKSTYPAFAAVQFSAEASLIGGLADWFAVVALFRHPFGLKLPHTAIVPENKNRIGQELGRFIEQNFVTSETIAPWLTKQNFVGRLLRWGSKPTNIRAALRALADALAPVMDEASEAVVLRIATHGISETLSRTDISALIRSALMTVLASGADRSILDRAISTVTGWLDENRSAVSARFGAHSPLTHPLFDSFVVNRFVDAIIDFSNDVAADPNHEVHTKFAEWLRDFAEHLETDVALKAQVIEIQRQFLGRIDVDALVRDAWHAIQAGAPGFDSAPIAHLIAQICRHTAHQRAAVDSFNKRLSLAVASGPSGARLRLSTLVEDVIRAWDTGCMTDKLELEIGRDLQFIRLNGMLVGGLAGLVLHPLLVLAGID
jgi:uncharacterized membrane-anchored protein YjiN (DUF445 family)